MIQIHPLFQTSPNIQTEHPAPFKAGDAIQVVPVGDSGLKAWIVISSIIPALHDSEPTCYIGQIRQTIGTETDDIAVGREMEIPHDCIFRFIEVGVDTAAPAVEKKSTSVKSTRKAIREDLTALLEKWLAGHSNLTSIQVATMESVEAELQQVIDAHFPRIAAQ